MSFDYDSQNTKYANQFLWLNAHLSSTAYVLTIEIVIVFIFFPNMINVENIIFQSDSTNVSESPCTLYNYRN